MKKEARNQQRIGIIQTLLLSLLLSAGVLGILGSGGGGGGAGGGGNKILAKGGFNDYSSLAGYGGGGGFVYIVNGYGGYGGGGDIEIKKTGKANASFTFSSSESDADLGANPVEVTEDTTFTILSSVNEAEPAAGTPYVVNTGGYLLVSEGNATPETTLANRNLATGLSVATGVTLTLPSSGNYIILANDVVNRGTIKTSDESATQKDLLYLEADAYYGGPSSAIITAGTSPGQNGGVAGFCVNAFYNKGTMDSSGADNASGTAGSGGGVQVYGECYPIVTENSGNIITTGGNGTTTYDGGYGGQVELPATEGHVYNSGHITTGGGTGASGGYGGPVEIRTFLTGEIRNSGDIDTSGGDASSGTGLAGYGGSANINSVGGEIASSGDITTQGGIGLNILGADANHGGNITISSDQDAEYIYVKPCATCTAGSITVSGNLNSSGGDSRNGFTNAYGGSISIFINDATDSLEAVGISLLGYDEIDSSAGDGYWSRNGNSVTIQNNDSFNGALGSSGNVVNQANIVAVGGSATDASSWNGGTGGSVTLDAGCGNRSSGYCHSSASAAVKNSGDIDTSGGAATGSTSTGGTNGSVSIEGFSGVTNSGNITAKGGDATYQGGNTNNDVEIAAASGSVLTTGDITLGGGTGGTIGGNTAATVNVYHNYTTTGVNDVYAEAFDSKIENRGAIIVSGGAGDNNGGYAGIIDLFGKKLKNSGDLTADGGDADPGTGGSSGGTGGAIMLDADASGETTNNSGTLSVTGGTGESAGTDGCTIIDGVTTGVCPG